MPPGFEVPVFLWMWALLVLRIKFYKMDILTMMKNKSEKDWNNLCEIFFRLWGHLKGFQKQKSNLAHFGLFLPTLKRQYFVDVIVFLFIV